MGFFDFLKDGATSVLNTLKGAWNWATGSSPIAQGIKSVATWAGNSGIPIISTIGKGYQALTSNDVGSALTSAQQALGSGNPADVYNAGRTLLSTGRGVYQQARGQ